jgi:hypothetical protein
MQKSRLEMPYSDFEENVMRRIAFESDYKKSISKNNRLSVLFFLLGTGFGLIINLFLSQSGTALFGISSDKILLFFQAGYILLLAIQLEKIISTYRETA